MFESRVKMISVCRKEKGIEARMQSLSFISLALCVLLLLHHMCVVDISLLKVCSVSIPYRAAWVSEYQRECLN